MQLPFFLVAMIGERTVIGIESKDELVSEIDWEKEIKKKNIPYNHACFLIANKYNNNPKKEKSVKFLRDHLLFLIEKFPKVYSNKDLDCFDKWTANLNIKLQ